MTLRSKTITGVALLQILLVAVLLVSSVEAMLSSGRGEIERRADVTVRLIAASATDAIVSQDFATLDAIAAEARSANSVSYLRFTDDRGNILTEVKEPGSDLDMVERAFPIVVAGAEFGRVQLGIDRASLDDAVLSTGRRSAMIAVGGIVLTALFSWMLGGYLTRQLEGLRRAGARLAGGDLAARVSITGDDELAETARAFNSMAERLQGVVKRLSDSEASLRAFSEASSDWTWETDSGHRFIWLSETFAEAAKARPEDYLGRSFAEMVSRDHDVDADQWRKHQEDMAAHRKFRDARYWIGSGRTAQWVSVSGAPRHGEDGIFAGYRGSARIITGQAEAAMQLRLFSQIVEQSPVSVVVTDPDGTIRYANPNFTRVTGYSLAEVVGKNPRLLSSGQTPLDVYQAMWNGVLNRSSWRGELLNKKKSGELYWEEAIIFPILDDHGQVAHLVGIKEDVSARKASVAMLEERTRLVQHHYECLRALSDIAALPDLAGGRQLAEALALGARHLDLPLGIISRIEGETYTVLNHVAPEPAGLHDGQTFTLGNTYCAMTLESGDVVAIAEMGSSPRAGHPCYRAFGLEAYIGAPVVVGGRVVGTVNFSSAQPFRREFDDGDIEFMRLLARWIGAVLERDQASRDILAARDQAEAARRDLARQARKLADINAELEQFAYVASHDLRQPLRMISSYITLIQRHLGDNLDEDLTEYFGFVVGGARRMDALIVGLLDYSRTGRSGASFEAVKLSEVVSESLLNLAVTIQEANAEVAVADGLPVVHGNRTDLVRLFQNLIGNAVKYRSPDRPVRVGVAARADEAEWVVSVEDNGIGIAADHRDRVFGIFQRLVTSDEYEGTGIGLAVCRKIMELHGGRIWVEDAADRGCRFLVAFPKG